MRKHIRLANQTAWADDVRRNQKFRSWCYSFARKMKQSGSMRVHTEPIHIPKHRKSASTATPAGLPA